MNHYHLPLIFLLLFPFLECLNMITNVAWPQNNVFSYARQLFFTIPISISCTVSDFSVFVPLSFSPYAVSMWTMARHQVAAPWTPWPARAQASSCRPILSTANGESRSCTAPTVTMTSHPSLCPGTPPLPVTCECMVSFAFTWTFIKYTQMLPIVLNVVNYALFCLSESVSQLNVY